MAAVGNAEQVVVHGFWRDEDGMPVTDPITLEPAPLPGQGTVPNVKDQTAHQWVRTKKRTVTADATSAYFAALVLASADPDVDPYGGRKVTFTGYDPYVIAVPYNAPTYVVDAKMKAAIPSLNIGDTVRALWLIDAPDGSNPPQPVASFYTATQTNSLIEQYTWKPRGAYAAGTAYVLRDVVQSGGSAWVAVGPSTGVTPGTDSTKWLQIVTGGTGPAGADGAPGQKGDKGDQGNPGTPGTNATNGTNGAIGPAGPGLPTGGTAGQVPVKASGTNYDIAWQTPLDLTPTTIYASGSHVPASGEYVRYQPTSGAISPAFPAAATRQRFGVANLGTANVTLTCAGSDTLPDGSTSLVLAPGDRAVLLGLSGGFAFESRFIAPANLPVSTAQAAALAGKLANPTEVSTTAAVASSALDNVATRFDTTSAAITQPLGSATAGRVVTLGWDAGANALTFTSTDPIGSSSSTSFVMPILGETLTLHGTGTRWRMLGRGVPQTNTDTYNAGRYAPLSAPTFSSVPREVYDLSVTSGQPTVTSATAAFTSADVGKAIQGNNIPFGATIASVQSATAATMSANAAATFANTTATIGTLSAPTPASIFTPRTPGRILNVIGDSIAPPQGTAIGFMGADGGLTGGATNNSLLWAHLLSDGQIIIGKQAGIGSQRIEMMLQRLATDILPFPAQFCLIQTSTNDLSYGHSVATWASYLRQICTALLAAGQTPVLVTGPPVPIAYRGNAEKYRRFVVAFALRNGFPLIDAYVALADTTGIGGYAAGFDSGDGTHPNNAGYRAYGQAIVDGLAAHLQPGKPPLARTNLLANNGGFVDNALFQTDTNSDGIPDGWVKGGSGAAATSIVTGDTNIVGNALRLVDTGNSGLTVFAYASSATIASGGRYAFTGRIKIDGNGPVRLFAYPSSQYPGGARVVYGSAVFGFASATGGWKRFYLEGVNNTGAARVMNIEFSCPGAIDADASIAQVAIHDLSGLSL